MRLIDADALLPMMKYATTDSEIGVFPIKIGFNAIAKVIDDAPTVDAVPVEWIKMRIKGLRGQLANADEDDKDIIWDLRTKIDELSGIAEYWRKEHETD